MTIDFSQQLLEEASSIPYKELPGMTLSAHAFLPENHQGTDQRTGILFFSAGLWDNSLLGQFAPHCLHFRQRGAVAIIIEYRELTKHRATPLEAILDAKSAFRWVRMNAAVLGVHPDRLVGIGASGGGHICLAATMAEGLHEPSESSDIPCEANALVLFSPVVDTNKKGVGFERFADPKVAKSTSPMENIRKGLPPMLIFQGSEDRVVPPKQVESFVKAVAKKKNICELVTYAREGHSFFNFNVNAQHFESTLNYMDQFLVKLGLLQPDEVNATNRLAS